MVEGSKIDPKRITDHYNEINSGREQRFMPDVAFHALLNQIECQNST